MEEYSHSIDNATATERHTMNRSSLVIAALSLSALSAAYAETPDLSGQFAASTAPAAQATRAQVQGQFADYRKTGVNPWSMSYNPLASFRSQKSREQVRNEFLSSRATVAAMTGEDSGSAYLATRQLPADASNQLAGQPTRSAQ
jgi:hypothetical protein